MMPNLATEDDYGSDGSVFFDLSFKHGGFFRSLFYQEENSQKQNKVNIFEHVWLW